MNKITKLICAISFCVLPRIAICAETLSSSASEEFVSAEALTKKLPQNFQGILYNCEPLCRFLSINTNKTWNPPLNKIKIHLQNPSWVLHTDPLYPLLIESLPVRPFVMLQPTENSSAQGKSNTSPIPPRVPFDYGFSFSLGLRGLQSHIKSSVVPQEDVSPTSLIQSPTAQLSFFRLKPIAFLSHWLQLRGIYESDLSGPSKMNNGMSINQSATNMHFDTLLMKDNYKLFLRLGQLTTDYKTEINLLSHYSFQETWTWAGVGYIYERFQMTLDYGLALHLTEQQEFRGPLLDSRFYRISAQWCSATKDVFDIKYGFCFNLSKKNSSISSHLNSNFANSEKFTVVTDENQLQLFLRFGDDFYL